MIDGRFRAEFGLGKVLASIWNELVYGSHLLAIGDALALYTLSLILNLNIDWPFLIVVYLSVIGINAFNRYKEYAQDVLSNPERSGVMQKYLNFFPYIIIVFLLVAIMIVLINANKDALIFMMFVLAFGISYTLFLKRFTKNIIGFKNIAAAILYAFTVIFMTLYAKAEISLATWLVLLFYFLRILLSTIFFDIKDIKSDSKDNLRTFAVMFGVKKTVMILDIINALSMVPIIYGIIYGMLPIYSLGILLTYIYAYYYCHKVLNYSGKKEFLYNVIADSEFIFWLCYILIGRCILWN